MITSEQVQAARTLLRWEQKDLAATLNAIPTALASAGVEFIAENGGGLGVPLKKTKRRTR